MKGRKYAFMIFCYKKKLQIILEGILRKQAKVPIALKGRHTLRELIIGPRIRVSICINIYESNRFLLCVVSLQEPESQLYHCYGDDIGSRMMMWSMTI